MAGDARTLGGPEARLAAALAVERDRGWPLVAGHARLPAAPGGGRDAAWLRGWLAGIRSSRDGRARMAELQACHEGG
jgi:hypothetical protein